jgi:hypothetical protein
MASYLGVQGYTDRLVPFARTGDDGSYAAFWSDDAGDQHIVHLGSGSGSLLTCLLGRTAADFVRLLSIGYPEICWLDTESYLLPPQNDAPSADEERGPVGNLLNRPLRDWVERQGSAVPSCAAQVMGRPAFMTEGPDSHDPFCRWLAKVCG